MLLPSLSPATLHHTSPCSAAFTFNALPFKVPYPVPFRMLGDEAKGWIDVTYLSPDGKLRLTRGNKVGHEQGLRAQLCTLLGRSSEHRGAAQACCWKGLLARMINCPSTGNNPFTAGHAVCSEQGGVGQGAAAGGAGLAAAG